MSTNEAYQYALKQFEETHNNIFLTGKAGTGKSTLLQEFRTQTKKKVVVLAPTGVAALNVGGQTIHSFFKFHPGVTPDHVYQQKVSSQLESLLQRVDTIIIDEVSMVRADLMDAIDASLRHHLRTPEPFGGLQMIFIGDLYQLPPVVTRDDRAILQELGYSSPYFFSAEVLSEFDFQIIQLEEIYRQNDSNFIELLNKIRNNKLNREDIEALNQRYTPNPHADTNTITLTTTNAAADRINRQQLAQLGGQIKTNHGEVSGSFSNRNLPTAEELEFKIGAQIMMLNNDQNQRWVNGSIGKITAIEWDDDKCQDVLAVKLEDGKNVKVEPHTWELKNYGLNPENNQLEMETIGSFTQYPFRLAWAVTIHKSQGKTFDQVIIDIGNGTFAHGQTYVALSRCRSFQGLTLAKPILAKHIRLDPRVIKFFESETNY